MDQIVKEKKKKKEVHHKYLNAWIKSLIWMFLCYDDLLIFFNVKQHWEVQ